MASRKGPPKVAWLAVFPDGNVVSAIGGVTRRAARALADRWNREDGDNSHSVARYVLAPSPPRPRAKKTGGKR